MRRRLGSTLGTALVVIGALLMTTSNGSAASNAGLAAGPPDPIPVGGVLSDAPPGAGFTRTGDADPNQPLHLGVGLQRDNAALNDVATAAAMPGTPGWGQHRTVAEVAATMAAPPQTADAAVAFFVGEGIDAWVDVTGLYVHATPTVGQASTLFGVTFGDYTGPGSAFQTDYVAADAPPTVPAGLLGLVAEITGLTFSLPYTQPPSAASASAPAALSPTPINAGTPSGCADALGTGGYTPDQMATAYGFDGLTPASGRRGEGAQLAVLIDGDGLGADAVAAYQSCFGLPPLAPSLHLVAPQPAPIEFQIGELDGDVETMLGLAPHLDRLDVFQGVAGTSQWPLLFSAPLEPGATGARLPDAVSFSDGDCERTMSPAVVRLLEDVLAVYAAVGVAVVMPAGDNGSATCPDLPGTSQIYPTSSPWVTAAGGTVITLDAANSLTGEVAWNDTIYEGGSQATGGGPSRMFPRPPWQDGPGVTGEVRGVPDVASFASQFPGVVQVVDFGAPIGLQWYGASGTSFAAPLVAAGIALVNAELTSRGLPRLGLPTPLLYLVAADGTTAAVRDVVEGTNDLNDRGCCTAGPGYDLTTGVGSLRFDALAEAATQFGPPAPPPPAPTTTVDTPAPAIATPPATLPATGVGDAETRVGLVGSALVIVGLLLVTLSTRARTARSSGSSRAPRAGT